MLREYNCILGRVLFLETTREKHNKMENEWNQPELAKESTFSLYSFYNFLNRNMNDQKWTQRNSTKCDRDN